MWGMTMPLFLRAEARVMIGMRRLSDLAHRHCLVVVEGTDQALGTREPLSQHLLEEAPLRLAGGVGGFGVLDRVELSALFALPAPFVGLPTEGHHRRRPVPAG